MSLRDDLQKSGDAAKDAEIKRLERRVTQLSAALESSRAARPVPKLKPAITTLITGDIVRVLVPDSHGSAQDNSAVAAFLGDLAVLNPDEIVLLGDHIDCGGFLAEHHVMGYVAETEYSYEEDVRFANAFLDAIQKAAPKAEIFYLEGNHEFRTERWAVTMSLRNSKDAEFLRKMVSPEILLHLKARGIRYFRQAEKYDGLPIPGTIKRGKCFFTHGFSTAKHAASVHLAKIGGNITYGHTHRAEFALSEPVNTGTIAAYSPGCLCKKQPLWNHTRPTEWTHGHGIQLIDRRTGKFFQMNIPIVDGVSMMTPFLRHEFKK